MLTAIAMLNVERHRVNEVAAALAELDGVSEVYSVGGRFDLIAIIRAKTSEELAEIATNHMLKVEGITNTETMIAFRAFSRLDLDSVFAIGAED